MEVNRAELLAANWKEMEAALLAFAQANGSTQRELLGQQHAMLRRGLARISIDARPSEKAYIALLEGVVQRMERVLYPNPVVRLLERLRAEFITRPKMIKEFRMTKQENLAELRRFMVERGFGVVADRLENVLDYEHNVVRIPMTGQLDAEQRLGLSLELVMDVQGRYRPCSVLASVTGSHGITSYQHFSLADPLDVPMVVNLLQGRAVCVPQADGTGGSCDKWLQLSTGKDQYLRNFYPDYGFDAAGLLKDLSVQFGMPGLFDGRLVDELRKGNQVSFIAGAPFNRKLLIEADPGPRELTIRNELGEKLEMRGLMEQKRAYGAQMEAGLQEVGMERSTDKVKEQERGLGA
ncbi:hypothetical protein [Pedobacter sp. UC225_65]|uniref:hypothetical protein n=1 Tax=Pedobacter sp. UC225_65 TaxID=3350173 RepID=UPI00366A6CCE